MKKLNRIGILLASVLLVTTYIFPLWSISLWAPQYPEGLSMQIWSSKFTGDVQTINILNHYIGMHAIQESSFPELQYFKIVFGILIGLGLLTAFFYKRVMVYIWTTSMIAFALWGLYDFWKWEFDFGHNLNPAAAIKMEDMVYQPPLIGTKEFLNIQATAWPELAGYGFTLAVLLSIAATVVCYIESKKSVSAKS
jgi:copper chaperone NosL